MGAYQPGARAYAGSNVFFNIFKRKDAKEPPEPDPSECRVDRAQLARKCQRIAECGEALCYLRRWLTDTYLKKTRPPCPWEARYKDIETRVVRAVFQEEGYSKSNTARHLGITRGTLNKKLARILRKHAQPSLI